MRQAILTKYIGPTRCSVGRVKAVADAGSITIEWDDALSSDENHERAAIRLAMKHEWLPKGAMSWMNIFRANFIAGGMPKLSGWANVYVCDDRRA